MAPEASRSSRTRATVLLGFLALAVARDVRTVTRRTAGNVVAGAREWAWGCAWPSLPITRTGAASATAGAQKLHRKAIASQRIVRIEAMNPMLGSRLRATDACNAPCAS